ncbi:hypothetical protein [Cellvibrio sp. PSBB023]|uniref:hypothetical protein n=1 Tax=Cellvibrio sp. PSBB023 TaxID=1945512 RepID=UPI00098FB6B2|nr:hypothetical protein [Cellvibrio sp. PSBB023]AQT61390.1 hypothetical protein B0D95_15700 [Cellvibrio sp. PSBB023]
MKTHYIFIALLGLLSCSQEVPTKDSKAVDNSKLKSDARMTETPSKRELTVNEVIDWGPQSTKAGVNPNIQADQGMGLWMRLSMTENLNEAKVLFDGKPALITTVDGSLITASIAAEQILSPGDKRVVIQLQSNQGSIDVGIFRVEDSQ